MWGVVVDGVGGEGVRGLNSWDVNINSIWIYYRGNVITVLVFLLFNELWDDAKRKHWHQCYMSVNEPEKVYPVSDGLVWTVTHRPCG
jgi:hypothetical protein